MNESALIIFPVLLKITQLLVGLAFSYFGYKLLSQGLFAGNSDLETKWKDFSFILKRGSPGTFFSLFGCAIVIFSIYSKSSFEITPLPAAPLVTTTQTQQEEEPDNNSVGGGLLGGGSGRGMKVNLAPQD